MEGIHLIAAFLDSLYNGNTPSGMALCDSSLCLNMNSAADVLEALMPSPFSLVDPELSGNGKPKIYKALTDHLSMRANWARPRDQKEPLTYSVFVQLSKFSSLSSICHPFLSKEALVYDTACLGCFTGSCVSEYAQAHVPKGQCFNIIPCNPDTGKWGGMPLAFIRDDFMFFSKELLRIDNSVAFACFMKGQVRFLQVHFRFDKADRNFSVCKFSVMNDPISMR